MTDKKILDQLVSFIDLTSLSDLDHTQSIQDLVEIANQPINGQHVAAVCTFPQYGNFVRSQLNSTIHAAVVGGHFPNGQNSLESKVEECKLIADSAVNEVDIVINRGLLIGGKEDELKHEIETLRKIFSNKCLKVILETGQLETEELIRKASQIAIDSGADFIKTSTGKIEKGASEKAVAIMSEEVLLHYKKTTKKIGIKASGGIRTVENALTYYQIVEKVLGKEWLQPSLFRIGASSLLEQIKQAY